MIYHLLTSHFHGHFHFKTVSSITKPSPFEGSHLEWINRPSGYPIPLWQIGE